MTDPESNILREGTPVYRDLDSVSVERLSITESFDPVATDSWLYRYDTNTDANGRGFQNSTRGI